MPGESRENQQPRELPERFDAEFMNAKSLEATTFFVNSNFPDPRSYTSDEGDAVFYEAVRGDGTVMLIKIVKGAKYKSPAEQDAEARASMEKK